MRNEVSVVTELAKWGNSQGVRLSMDILRHLNLDVDMKEGKSIRFKVDVGRNSIILTPINRNTKLDIMFKYFKGEPKEYIETIDWGEPVGKEIW